MRKDNRFWRKRE